MGTPPPPSNWEPTLEEIREMCQRIQGEWTDYERRRRSGMSGDGGKVIREVVLRLPRGVSMD